MPSGQSFASVFVKHEGLHAGGRFLCLWPPNILCRHTLWRNEFYCLPTLELYTQHMNSRSHVKRKLSHVSTHAFPPLPWAVTVPLPYGLINKALCSCTIWSRIDWWSCWKKGHSLFVFKAPTQCPACAMKHYLCCSYPGGLVGSGNTWLPHCGFHFHDAAYWIIIIDNLVA